MNRNLPVVLLFRFSSGKDVRFGHGKENERGGIILLTGEL